MSEEGWHGFLAAEGVDDWVVLHGGATAVFQSLMTSAETGELASTPTATAPAIPMAQRPNVCFLI